MRADFETHRGTMMLYPARKDVWRKHAVPISETVTKLALEISKFEPIILGVHPELDRNRIARECDGVRIEPMLYNDIWIRDSGAVPNEDALVKFGFNAWGGDAGLYSDWSLDETVPEQMSKLLNLPVETSSLVLEGGNLLCDGRGTLISIRSTLCNENRNPNVEIETVEKLLKQTLRIEQIIWLDEGLVYDETGGHVDNLCAFADERTILLSWTDDLENSQYDVVRSAYAKLEAARSVDGKPYNIVKIPLPQCFARTEDDCAGLVTVDGSKERYEGELIQPSYINFVFVNGGVIVPSFDDPADGIVKELFERTFPDRQVIDFPAREILLGGGGMHCITKNY